MQIWALSECPFEAARMLDDARLSKAPLEAAQILCSALRRNGYDEKDFYKKAHVNVPLVIWAGRTRGNFEWLLNWYRGLILEVSRRKGFPYFTRTMLSFSPDRFEALLDKLPLGSRENLCNWAANVGRSKATGIYEYDYRWVLDTVKAYTAYYAFRIARDNWLKENSSKKWTPRPYCSVPENYPFGIGYK